jgi:hypothetical protein
MNPRPVLLASALLLAACGGASGDMADTTLAPVPDTTEAPASTWEEIAPPVVEGETDPVVVEDGVLNDGYYWASVSSVSGSGELVFEVTQVRFGTACEEWAATMGGTVECMNDYGVQVDPSGLVSLADDAEVSVATPGGPGTNYTIDAATLAGLVDGTVVSPLPDYVWTPFPFVIVVEGSVVTSAHQFWVP